MTRQYSYMFKYGDVNLASDVVDLEAEVVVEDHGKR